MHLSPSLIARRWLPALLLLSLVAFALQPNAQSRPVRPNTTTAAVTQPIELQWRDDSRGRDVPALLFMPTPAPATPAPLIVFSHGIGSSRDGYTYLGRFWADHGIASLHLQHVGSDRSLWQGSPETFTARFNKAAGDGEAIDRALDVRFALDQLLAGEQAAAFDRQRIVAAGHSYGANTTLLVAGARVVRAGKVLPLRDPRITAAIVISAPPFYGEKNDDGILAGITIPTLHITTMEDVIRLPGFESGVSDRLKVFDTIGGFKVLAVYKHGSHNVFTEQRYFDSVAVTGAVKNATEQLSLVFLEQVFGNQDQLAQWGDQHSALLADYVLPQHTAAPRILGSR